MKRGGRFEEVNNSIFVFAEKYISSKVNQTNELEHSAGIISTIKQKQKKLNEEIKQTDWEIIKKQKMVKSDIHAFQGLMFEVSATRASLCQRKETKGSIERRMNSLMKILGRENENNMKDFVVDLQRLANLYDGGKKEFQDIRTNNVALNQESLKLREIICQVKEDIVKTEVSISKLTQENEFCVSEMKSFATVVSKFKESINGLSKLVEDCNEKVKSQTQKKDGICSEVSKKQLETEKLTELGNQTEKAMISEWNNTLRKRFHERFCGDKLPSINTKNEELSNRLTEINSKNQKKLLEITNLKKSTEKYKSLFDSLRSENESKKQQIQKLNSEKEILRNQNDKLRNDSKEIDKQIPQVFTNLRKFQVEKKKKMELLMVENSKLEVRIQEQQRKSNEKSRILELIELKKEELSEIQKKMELKNQTLIENQKSLQEKREKYLHICNCEKEFLKNIEKNKGMKNSKIAEIEERIDLEITNLKKKESMKLDSEMSSKLKKYEEMFDFETTQILDKIVIQKASSPNSLFNSPLIPESKKKKFKKLSPPIRNKNLNLKNPKKIRKIIGNNNVSKPVVVNTNTTRINNSKKNGVDGDLSYIGFDLNQFDKKMEFSNDEEIETESLKRRKLNSGNFISPKKKKKKKKKQERSKRKTQKKPEQVKEEDEEDDIEIGGISDLEFSMDDIFGEGDFDESSSNSTPTPLRQSTTMVATPGSTNTPSRILDVFIPSTKKKKTKKKIKLRKKKSKKKNRKRKRSSNIKSSNNKKKIVVSNNNINGKKKMKMRKKKKKKIVVNNDLDSDLDSDGMDLSVFDF